jgi:EAL domain-containing protein (putative c-di-GMP-specific phosphodiesterase class I)
MWIENISETELMTWFDQVNLFFKRDFVSPNMNKKLSFYIGYAAYTMGENKLEACYQKASLALTYAKSNDIQDIIAYNETFERLLRHDEHLKELLLSAIANKTFEIYYQTKVDALTNEIIGVEALARWCPPTLGYIGPSIFVPMVEKMHQAIVFGGIIIEKVFMEYDQLCRKYKKTMRVAINISPSHLMSEGFVQYVSQMAKKYNIQMENIILEMTEEVMIQGEQSVNVILNDIRQLGINISLDDFGTGYSSLNYLIKLDVDELKIDKSFIDQLRNNDKIIVLLQSIIYIAKKYDLVLIAEGVETQEQRDKLVELGCHNMQGYYYSKPEPIELTS